MIPSTPRRTWAFLAALLLAFYAPDLLVPAPLAKGAAYAALYILYQAGLVLALFGFGPAICRVMVVREAGAGPEREGVEAALAGLLTSPLPDLPVTLAEYPAPFIVTAGLLPGRCRVFLSTGLAARLGPAGLRFQLARARLHASTGQRLATLVPLLAVAAWQPDDYTAPATLASLAVISVAWLAVHWLFELRTDRQAARALGAEALQGLAEVEAAGAGPLARFTLQPPRRWRLRAVAGPRRP